MKVCRSVFAMLKNCDPTVPLYHILESSQMSGQSTSYAKIRKAPFGYLRMVIYLSLNPCHLLSKTSIDDPTESYYQN